MDRIAVLIPCYNESKTIEKVVRDFRAALPEAVVYVYDNNSTDGTDKLARAAGAVVRYEHQQGKGNVIRSMFREIDAEAYLMADGDDTYPAEFARALIDPVLRGEADMTIGDRLSATYFSENKRPFHNMGNSMVRSLINTLFDTDVKDIMTGYRSFSYEFVKTFPVLSQGFEIETEMTIHALDKNLHLVSVPVTYRDRPQGSVSKLNTYSDGARVLRTVFRLYRDYRPLRFFGIIALILLAIALLLGVPVLIQFFQTGLVPRFPTLIVSGGLCIAALLSYFSGLILDVLVQKSRQEFEIKANFFRHLHKQLKSESRGSSRE